MNKFVLGLLALGFISITVLADEKVDKTSAKYLWAEQECGGAAEFKKDEKKFEKCVDAKMAKSKNNPMEISADQLWADQQCGGRAAFTKDEKTFNACVEEKLKSKKSPMGVSAEQIWADQQCGGNVAFKKDEKKFNACVEEKLQSKCPTYSAPACGGNAEIALVADSTNKKCKKPVCVQKSSAGGAGVR